MAGFHEVQFPTNIAYGSRGGPGFKTDIITTDSGAEQRVSRWSAARRKYDVSTGIRSQADVSALINFYLCRSGPAYGFRFKDFADFTSNATDPSYSGAALTNVDQQIGIGDGSVVAFQLIKSYTSGPVTRTRNITKPVSGTTVVALNGVNQTSGWTIDTTTGIVTFTTAPTAGVVVTAGFQFDVPVRFADELDDNFPTNFDNYNSGSVGSITLVEVKDTIANSDLFFYGGAEETNPSADVQLQMSSGRVQVFLPTTTGLSVKMPDTTSLPAGGPYFILINEHATAAMTVKTSGGTTIATLSAGAALMMVLSVDAAHTKYWYAA